MEAAGRLGLGIHLCWLCAAAAGPGLHPEKVVKDVTFAISSGRASCAWKGYGDGHGVEEGGEGHEMDVVGAKGEGKAAASGEIEAVFLKTTG